MNESKIPAAKNCDRKVNGCNLNIARQLQQTNIRYALCSSYTYGGQTAAVVLKSFDGETMN
jgi:3-oxoacyl-(acyl-carrier-protein) synthase